MPSPLAISESLAILSSGLFAAAALYIFFVEHPARMLCGTTVAITEFAPSYKRATVYVAAVLQGGYQGTRCHSEGGVGPRNLLFPSVEAPDLQSGERRFQAPRYARTRKTGL